MKIPQNEIDEVLEQSEWWIERKLGFKSGVEFAEHKFEEAFENTIIENQELKLFKDTWNKMVKINPDPEKWLKVYSHYLDLLTQEDVANFWQEQFNLQVANKGDLAIEFGEFLQNYDEPIYKVEGVYEQFLKNRNNE